MTLRVFIDGVASWSNAAPPAPALLAANERRRASDAVLLAIEVASRAIDDAGLDGQKIASVFTSAYGDLAITDALCRTLADDPLLLSPTRFHHSVHNAASGYWAIADHNMAASTALAAGDHSFAAGLLEAACQCLADAQPVLLVGVDTAAVGALAATNPSRSALGVALVVSPRHGPRSRWRLDIGDAAGGGDVELRVDNPMRRALPLLGVLDAARPALVTLKINDHRHLDLDCVPLHAG